MHSLLWHGSYQPPKRYKSAVPEWLHRFLSTTSLMRGSPLRRLLGFFGDQLTIFFVSADVMKHDRSRNAGSARICQRVDDPVPLVLTLDQPALLEDGKMVGQL